MQGLHTRLHDAVIDRDATRHDGHAFRIHTTQGDQVAFYHVALPDNPDIALATLFKDGMGRNRQATDGSISTYINIYIDVHTRTEFSIQCVLHGEELVGVGLHQFTRLVQIVTDTRRHAIGLRRVPQQAIDIRRDIHFHLHATGIHEIHHGQPGIHHLCLLKVHLLDGAIHGSRQPCVAQLVLSVLQLDA